MTGGHLGFLLVFTILGFGVGSLVICIINGVLKGRSHDS